MNKPLPHRPFSMAPQLEKGHNRRTSDTTLISSPDSSPARPTFHAPPRPTRAHPAPRTVQYTEKSPSSSYPFESYPTQAPISSYKPKPQARHAHSHSQTSTSDLIPKSALAAVESRPPPSWARRHWFVIFMSVCATIGIIIAVALVVTKRGATTREAGVYRPTSDTDPASPISVVASSLLEVTAAASLLPTQTPSA